jgi:hypothetical protein
MPFSIGQFRDMGQLNASRLILKDDSVVDGSSGKSLLWKSKSEKMQNTEIMKQFKTALTRTFGESIAQSAFNSVIGSVGVDKGKPLSSRMVKQILDAAQSLASRQACREMFSSVSGRSISDIMKLVDGMPPDSLVGYAMRNAVSNLGFTVDILSESPAGPENITQFQELARAQLGALEENLERLEGLDMDDGTQPAIDDIKRELKGQIQQLKDKIEYVDRQAIGDPLSQDSVANARKLWSDAAISVISQEVQKLVDSGQDDKAKALIKLQTDIASKSWDELMGARLDTREGKLKNKIKNQPKELEKLLTKEFKKLGVSTKKLDDRLHHAHVDMLNHGQKWESVKRDVLFMQDGHQHKFSSVINPATTLGNVFTSDYKGGGVSSHSFTESKHTVNLCESILTMPTQDGGEKVVFKGLRHGIHSAFGIQDSTERAQANLNRAKETVKAALLTNPELLQKALNGETVPLPMTSISLVTPDDARGFINDSFGALKHDNERRQMLEQVEAWETLSDPQNQPIEIEVLDEHGVSKTVKINPDVIALNFGVNGGALNAHKGIFTDLIGGWGNSKIVNEDGLKRLLGDLKPGEPLGGRVGEFLAKCDDPRKKEVVTKLCEQIKKMWADGSYMTMGKDPYKMAARLAVLANMIDNTTVWNCKSGKDRTGELDVEAKFLAAQIELTGDVPEPEHELSDEETRMFREFALNTGSLEIQQYNTGISGFKTEGVSAITERMGDFSAREVHRGGAPFVKG